MPAGLGKQVEELFPIATYLLLIANSGL